MIRFLLMLLISLILLPVASAIPTGDLEFGQPQIHILHIGESVNRGEYTIEASDFFLNRALITIYDKDQNILSQNITGTGDYVNYNDAINVSTLEVHTSTGNTSRLNVPVDQWVKIESKLAGKPHPTIALQLDKYEYRAGAQIPLNISVRNYGTGTFKKVMLTLQTNLTTIAKDKTEHDLHEIKPGNTSDNNNISEMLKVRFKAPSNLFNTTYNITAIVTGEDAFGNQYRKEDTIYFTVLGSLEVDARKHVRDRTYIGETIHVTLTIENKGTVSIKNLTLTDKVPAPLQTLPNQTLKWNFDLPAKTQKTITYPFTTNTPGAYILPEAKVEWKFGKTNYTVKTKKVRTVLSGPYVTVTKTADKTNTTPNGTVNITLKATNTGDQTAIVRVQDRIPGGTKLVKGTLYKSIILYPGTSKTHTYTLQLIEKGTITLPEALTSTTDLLQFYEDPGQITYSRHNIRDKTNTLKITVAPLKPKKKTFQEQIGKTITTPTPTPHTARAETTPSATEKTETTPATGIIPLITIILLTTLAKKTLKK